MQDLADLEEPATIPLTVHLLFDRDVNLARQTALLIETLFASVPVHLISKLDALIRTDSYFGALADKTCRSRPDAESIVDRLPDSTIAIGIASCHPSGYVRECATRKLDLRSSSGKELPFLLVRLNDWVPSVRLAAEVAVERRLTRSFNADFLMNLPLIGSLSGRNRINGSRLIGPIEDLLRSDPTALIQYAVKSKESGTCRYGLKLALGASAEQGTGIELDSLEAIIEESPPAARQYLATWLVKPSAPEALQSVLVPKLLDDSYFAVRRAALGWCSMRHPSRYLNRIRDALLDESRVVRNLAQFHIRKLESLDLRSFYRESLTSVDPKTLRASLHGLGETGLAEDARLVLPFVDSNIRKTAQAALESLGKLDAITHLELFVKALHSASPSLSRQARIVLDAHAREVGSRRFEQIFQNASHGHVRVNVVMLVNRLAKWEKVSVLMALQAGSPSEACRLALNFLINWLQTYNQSHEVRPTDSELKVMRLALDLYGSKLNPKLESELRAMARMG